MTHSMFVIYAALGALLLICQAAPIDSADLSRKVKRCKAKQQVVWDGSSLTTTADALSSTTNQALEFGTTLLPSMSSTASSIMPSSTSEAMPSSVMETSSTVPATTSAMPSATAPTSTAAATTTTTPAVVSSAAPVSAVATSSTTEMSSSSVDSVSVVASSTSSSFTFSFLASSTAETAAAVETGATMASASMSPASQPEASSVTPTSTVASSAVASAAASPMASTSSEEADSFVALHNTLRSQYGAGQVTWNDTLAEYAQNAANTCKYGHTGGPYGENIAAGVGGGYNLTSGFESWANEAAHYNWQQPGFADATGHFTQAVWKDTSQIGCASVPCGANSIFQGYGNQEQVYVVCEYWTPGNVEGDDDQFFKLNVGIKL